MVLVFNQALVPCKPQGMEGFLLLLVLGCLGAPSWFP